MLPKNHWDPDKLLAGGATQSQLMMEPELGLLAASGLSPFLLHCLVHSNENEFYLKWIKQQQQIWFKISSKDSDLGPSRF